MEFWKRIDKARTFVKDDMPEEALKELECISVSEMVFNENKKLEFLEKFSSAYQLGFDVSALENKIAKPLAFKPKEPKVNNIVGKSIDNYVEEVGEGVSLVTCCKNRNENLVKAIPSWIACSDIDEIVIVDWSSDEPVKEYLEKSSINDERIKVVRVDNQPRWILSYAFNIGFRIASYDKVLKTDADIVLSSDFFKKNKLTNDVFIAGDWRKAEKGQEFINGFFYVPRVNLERIKGFNEYITTYGWDDDDIYERLGRSGLKRKLVDTSTIYHLPHDDSQRTGELGNTGNHLDKFFGTTKAKIRANRFIANVMPTWDKTKVQLPFTIAFLDENLLQLAEAGETIHCVPKHIKEDANYYSAVEQLSWQVGLRAFDLDRAQLYKLLDTKPFEKQTTLDVEVAIYNTEPMFEFKENYLVIEIEPDIAKCNQNELVKALKELSNVTRAKNFGMILASDSRVHIANLLGADDSFGFIPSWRNLGHLHEKSLKNLLSDSKIAQSIKLQLSQKSIGELENLVKRFATKVKPKKNKFYVDAQHGLGNRLRAIGSAAAIAEATERELVIVWEPDHHCDCRFSDLFDYDGPVIEKRFVENASQAGMHVFNYMEIEEGSEKDKLIPSNLSGDIYGRAAYVFNSEYSFWDEENKFIRSLTPSKPVQKLIEDYNLENCVGVHIRMEAGKGLDHNTYDDVSNWTEEGHEQIHYWREKSHYSHFIKHIEELMRQDADLALFLATDLPETYEVFQKCFGEKCRVLKRELYDRSREQIIYALADVLLLSKCDRLLGSTWSSFSELAMRLSTNYSKIEMSGRDF